VRLRDTKQHGVYQDENLGSKIQFDTEETSFPFLNEEISFLSRSGERYWIIHNPTRDTYIRLTQEEHDLWKKLHTKETEDENMQDTGYSRQDPCHISSHELSVLFRADSGIGCHDTDPSHHVPERAHHGWLSRYWEITIPLHGMNRIFDILDWSFGWILRSRWFTCFFLFFCTAGLAFFLITEPLPSYPALMGDDSQLLTILSIYLILITAAILHIFGHALACRTYGRKIGDSGLLLYYGMPCLYIDTSDIWMADRKARIIVSLAGPAVNIFIGACTALLVFAFPGNDQANLLWRIAFLSFAVALINLCPLLEFDGYYALTDLLEIPDLRERAFSFLRSLIQKSDQMSHEGWFFLVYAVSSAIFTLGVVIVGVYFWQEHVTDLLTELGKDRWEMDHILATLAIILVFVPFLTGMIISGIYSLLQKIRRQNVSEDSMESADITRDRRILMRRLSK
jgi:putative peptide zinc metalloprotease protein